MAMPAIYEQLFDCPARIEAMWPFPVSSAPGPLIEALETHQRVPSPLFDWINKWPEHEQEDLFNGETSRFHDAYDELCARAFREGVHGWLAVIATPVMSYHGPTANSASFSWGHYHTALIFAETAEAILEKAEKWAEAMHEVTKMQAQEGQANG